jgi:hypothetical protein
VSLVSRPIFLLPVRYTLLLGEQEYTPADKTEAYLTGTFPNVNHAPLIKP